MDLNDRIAAGLRELDTMSDERFASGFMTQGRVESHMRVKFSDLRRVLLAMKEPSETNQTKSTASFEFLSNKEEDIYTKGDGEPIKPTEKECKLCHSSSCIGDCMNNINTIKTTEKELVPLSSEALYKDLYHSTFLAGHFVNDERAKEIIRAISNRIAEKFGTKPRKEPSHKEIIDKMKQARLYYSENAKEFWNEYGQEYEVADAILDLFIGEK